MFSIDEQGNLFVIPRRSWFLKNNGTPGRLLELKVDLQAQDSTRKTGTVPLGTVFIKKERRNRQ